MDQSSFEIDTNGTCIFCLNPNCTPLDRNKVDLTTAGQLHLKMLFRYLDIDIRKVAASVSPFEEAISVNASTNLAVSLCDTCAFLLDEFLELFEEFEKIRLKLDACTWKLHEFMGNGAKNESLTCEYQRRVLDCGELHLKFVEELRKEIFERCSKKLDSSIPKIRLRRQTINRVGEAVSCVRTWRKDTGDDEWSRGTGVMENIGEVEVEGAESEPVNEIDEDTKNVQLLDIPVKVEIDDGDRAVWREGGFIVDGIATATSEPAEEFSYPADLAEEATHQTKDTNPNTLTRKKVWPKKKSRKKVIETTCTTCQIVFSTGLSLTRHRREVHLGKDMESPRVQSVKSVRCPHCSKYFSESSALRVHKYLVHPVHMLSACLPPDATDLDVTRALTNILGNRITYAKTKSEVSCPLCSKTYTQPPKLKVHILQFHEDQVCQRIQSRKHQQTAKEKETKTPTRSKIEIVPRARVHLETEASSSNPTSTKTITPGPYKKQYGNFKCELCGKIFFWEKMWKRHLQQFHVQTQKPTPINYSTSLNCNHCDTVYTTKTKLQYHLNLEHPMQLYKARIPPRISEHAFKSALDALVNRIQIQPVAAVIGRKHPPFDQIVECVFCRQTLSCENIHVHVHVVRSHLDKVIEEADAIIGKGIIVENSSESPRALIHNSAGGNEIYPLIPFQFDEEEREADFDGEETLRDNEDPLGF